MNSYTLKWVFLCIIVVSIIIKFKILTSIVIFLKSYEDIKICQSLLLIDSLLQLIDCAIFVIF